MDTKWIWRKNLDAVAAFALTALVIGAAGMEENIVVSSTASRDTDHWYKVWAGTDAEPAITLPHDLAPAMIPGPADGWGGGKPRAVTATIPAPPGRYFLKIEFFDAHESAPPVFQVSVNGKETVARLPAGKGSPPPYDSINERLTVAVPAEPDHGVIMARLVSSEGSWAAPARISLVNGRRFNPAKAGYILVTDAGYQAALALVVLGGAIVFVARRKGLREAAVTALLLTVSVAMAAAMCEFAFRAYLRINPQGRYPQTVEGRLPAAPSEGDYGPGYIQEPMYDPDIPYRLRRNLDGTFLGKRLTSNEYGMRGPAAALEKTPGTIRVMGLGDSFLFGWGVADGETALDRLAERIAQAAGRPAVPLNLSVPSYNTAVEVAVYRKLGRQFDPDVVVLMFTGNDFGFPYIMVEPVWLWTLEKNYLAERARREFAFRWDGAPREESRDHITMSQVGSIEGSDAAASGQGEDVKWIKQVRDHYYRMTGKDAVAAAFKELAVMLREDGAAGIVIYADSSFQTGRPETYEPYGEFVIQAAREAGLTGMRIAGVYDAYLMAHGGKKLSDLLWISREDVHPNAVAHAMIGDAAFEELERGGIMAGLMKRP